MTIAYLKGNEQASATYMNALYSEFDAKFAKLLGGGKSFFLAQDAAMPAKFCGRAFFFTTGPAVYARRVPGWIDSGGGVTRPYNHSQFTTAVAAINKALVTWDEANKVALVPAFLASVYSGLPSVLDSTTKKPIGTGLLDWSLQAHTLLHQGASDTQPVPYYIQETSINSSVAPEKHYRFCVAEIIIEGPALVTLLATFDKYSCFRIHNFNSTVASVKFPTDPDDPAKVFTVTLKPFSCATVRRDAAVNPGANYRAGYNYFFKFEGGDPRFYWFAPKAFVGSSALLGDSTAVTNTMQANNLTNPAILLDWVNFFLRDLGPGSLPNQTLLDQNGFYAGWQQDPAVQANVGDFYKNFFGGNPQDKDPLKDLVQPTTLLGDLIHHKGDILIIRSSKTANDPVTGKPVVVIDKIKFNGYATILNDFAAKQLGVQENGSGDLVISNVDTANNVYLIPYGTNMFKTGETHPTCVSLVGKSFTLESALFENPDPIHLSSTAPQLIFQPAATLGSTSRTWLEWNPVTTTYDKSKTLVGNPQTTLNWAANRSTSTTLHGIHKIKVSDLLTLDWWGDPKVPGQSSAYVAITNQKLTLTPEGLVITYTETDSALRAPGDSNWITLKRGVPTVKSIAFRGHGFGYFGANGSRDTGWLSPRSARFQFTGAYQYEAVGPAGADFQVQGGPTQSTVAVLSRLKLAGVSAPGRFFGTKLDDNLLKFIENTGLDNRTFGALFGTSTETNINNGSAPVVTGAVTPVAMTLLPEMYNGLARAVNAINRASPLSWKCLRWNVFGKSVGLSTVVPFGTFFNGSWDPNTNKSTGVYFDTGSLQSGVGVPGFQYQCQNAGATPLDGNSGWVQGDVATFTLEGKWVKSHPSVIENVQFWGGYDGGAGNRSYAGIMPMNCFATFNVGSQFHALCNVLGIPVRTAADMPGAVTGETLAVLQSAEVANGILLGEVICTAAETARDTSSSPFSTSAELSGAVVADLLSAKKLLNGEATGSQCFGIWDDSLLVGSSVSLVSAGYGDIGKYWVVPGDRTSGLGDMKRGDLVMIKSFSGDPDSGINGVVELLAMANSLNKRKGITLAGFDLNAFTTTEGGIRWVTIDDVKTAVETTGFQFSYLEQCIPMALYYFEEPSAMKVLFQQTSRTASASGTTNGPINSSDIRPSLTSELFGDPNLGKFIKCVPSKSAGAAWKSRNFETVFGAYPIADINPTNGHSPIVYSISGHMNFNPTMLVSTGIGSGQFTGNGQFIGPASDTISSDTDVSSTFFIGYIAAGFDPTTLPDIVNQRNNVLDRGAEVAVRYDDGVNERQLFVEAFQMRNSDSFQAFPTQILMVGNETWTRPAGWWVQSLFNYNWFTDSLGTGPWQYFGVGAAITVTLGSNNITLIAPPDSNTNYTMLSNAGPPLVKM